MSYLFICHLSIFHVLFIDWFIYLAIYLSIYLFIYFSITQISHYYKNILWLYVASKPNNEL